MQVTGGDVAAFVADVTPATRRRDAATLVALMRDITGHEPELWGTIVGFGSQHYRTAGGTEGDMPLLAFAPQKASTTIYLDDASAHADDLALLGPHTSSVSCLYVRDLEKIDGDVLRRVLERCVATSESAAN